MATTAVCPACKAVLKTQKDVAVGKSVTCPKCQKPFRYEGASGREPAEAPRNAAPVPAEASSGTGGKGGLWAGVVFVAVVLVAGFGYVKFRPQNPPAEKPKGDQESKRENPGPGPGPDDPRPVPGPNVPNAVAAVALPSRFKIDEGALGLAFSPDGRLLACAGDLRINLRDLHAGKTVRTFEFASARGFLTVAFSPDGAHLAVVARDPASSDQINGAVWAVSGGEGNPVVTFKLEGAPSNYIAPLEFSPKGKYVAFPGNGREVVVHDLSHGKEYARLKGHTGWPGDFAFTADESRLVSGSGTDGDSSARLWDMNSPADGRILEQGKGATRVALSPDGRSLVTCAQFDGPERATPGEVCLWDVPETGLANLRPGLETTASEVRILPDGKTLALLEPSAFSVRVKLWDISSGKPIGRPFEPAIAGNDQTRLAVFSPDGKTLAVAVREMYALWDVASGQRRALFQPESAEGHARACAFSPDGLIVAGSLDDGSIFLWPARGATLDAVARLENKSRVRDVRFSADGKTLIARLHANDASRLKDNAAFRRDLDGVERQYQELRRRLDPLLPTGRGATRKKGDRSPDAEVPDEDWKNLDAKVFRPLREFKADAYRKLAEAHEGESPLGEVATLWDVASSRPVLTLKQPVFSQEEFTNGFGRAELLASLTDTVFGEPKFSGPTVIPEPAPLGNGGALRTTSIQGRQLVWLHRQKGLIQVDLESREETELGRPVDTFVTFLQSADGKTVFVAGQGPKPQGETIVALVDTASKSVRPLTAPGAGRSDGWSLTYAPTTAFLPAGDRMLTFFVRQVTQSRAREGFLQGYAVANAQESGSEILIKNAPYLGVSDLTVGPDGKTIAFLLVRNQNMDELAMYDLATGSERPTTLPKYDVNPPAYSPDGRTLAVPVKAQFDPNTFGHHIYLVDVASGQTPVTIKEFTGFVHALAFSPNGRMLAVGGGSLENPFGDSALSASSEVKVFDSGTGSLVSALAADTGIINSLAFSPDSRTLAASNGSRTITLWDVSRR